MRIAVIGWGSLMWNRRDLDIEDNWHVDGPMLPVEFARVSSRNRLTLVLVDSVPPQPTLWAKSRKAIVADAIKDLAKREGTYDDNIGRWPCTDRFDRFEKRIASIVAAWAHERKLDAAVWTALCPKKPNGEPGLATDEELITYLRALAERGDDAAAKEYVEKAPKQINTPLRARICRELGWQQVGE